MATKFILYCGPWTAVIDTVWGGYLLDASPVTKSEICNLLLALDHQRECWSKFESQFVVAMKASGRDWETLDSDPTLSTKSLNAKTKQNLGRH